MKVYTTAERKLIRSMADTMRELGDNCTRDALIRRGFTGAEIDAYSEAATELANAEANRRAA